MLTLLFLLITIVLVVGAAELVREFCRRQLAAPVQIPVQVPAGADSARID